MATEIENIERRTVRHGFQDGIYEMSLGILLLLLGLYFLGRAFTTETSAWAFVFDVGFLPMFLFGGWLIKKFIRSLKENITYPRAGYISYRRREGRKRTVRAALLGGTVGALGAIAALLFSSKPAGFNWLPAVSGLAFGLALSLLSFRSGLARLAVPALMLAASGVTLAFSGLESMLSLAAFYSLGAALLIASGAVACRRFIRRNPLPEEAGR